MNDDQVKPRSLRFTWSMKTTSSRDPNEIMAEIRKVCLDLIYLNGAFKWICGWSQKNLVLETFSSPEGNITTLRSSALCV